ncbi:MAG TPA: hypothetical protein VHD31_00525 [Candidatus Paceibacterota bacterium]|nr:hypothetical protein [Candidatus Paceibacterota bacterium]
MTRRILYIIIGALVILALIVGLWFWLFSGGGAKVTDTGTLGTGGDRNNTSTGTIGSDVNGQVPVGSNAGTGVSGQGSGGGYSDGTISYVDLGSANPSGATWLDGSSVTSSSGSGSLTLRGAGSLFNPTPINQVTNTSVYGTSYIGVDPATVSSGGGNNFGAGLAGVAAACLAKFAASQLAGTALGSIFGALSGQVNVNDSSTHANQQTDSILKCVTMALARIAIDKITNDTVNWINSGFEGKPAFVQDYNKFFNDVADQAAGSVIEGSNLAFLCSPFQLKVRIAIAQSYARRNNAPSCTLSGVVGNIEKFAGGDFSQGGWPGLISFTTMPTNNPFGAYMYGQVAIEGARGSAVLASTQELNNGQGFLCAKDKDGNCVTPGSAILGAFNANVQSTLNELNLAQSIDEIIGALTNALITKMFNKGLSNLGNGQNGYGASLSTEDLQAEGEANDLLDEMQTSVQYAQQYGAVEQGDISDIQNAQANLTTLGNCWTAANKTDLAQSTADKIAELEGQVTLYNNKITAANQDIADIQAVQTQVLSATTLLEVRAAAASYAQLKNSGSVYDSTDITSAQQDRTTLQAQMNALNSDTSTKLNQCYALGQ